MKLKKAALQTLSVVTAVGLSLGVAPAIAYEGNGAKDLPTDNAQNMAGGGVNIHADNTCVEKVGDTAHVKFEVQHQPLELSSDRHWTAADGYIALPKTLQNVKIGIKAVGGPADVKKENGDFANSFPVQKAAIYDTPVDMPIVDYEDNPNPPAMLGGSPVKQKDDGETEDERAIGYVDRGFTKKTDPDPKNPNQVIEHYLPTEKELRDHIEKFDVHMRKLSPTPYTGEYGVDEYGGPFSKDMGFGMWYGNNIADYNIYEFGSVFLPTSFEIEADVVVDHDDTFVTGAVSNLGQMHFDEVEAGDSANGFYLEGGVGGYDGWARPGFLPPAIPSDPKMIEIYKEKLTDAGLDISPRIAPTSEMVGDSKYLRIGNDTRPSARGDAGISYYTHFGLVENRAVTYIGQVPHSGEDGADITAAHVTLCPSEETPTTTKTLLPPTSEKPTSEKPTTEKPTTSEPTSEKPTTSDKPTTEPTPTTSEKPSGSSLDEETMKKVGIGLGLGLGGAKLIEKIKEHKGGNGSSHNEHTTEPKPAPSTTQKPAPSTTQQAAPTTTQQAAPTTTAQSAPTTTAKQAAPATTSQAAAPSKTGTLAQTGANVTTLAVAGSLIVLAGAAFLLVGRRRKEEN